MSLAIGDLAEALTNTLKVLAGQEPVIDARDEHDGGAIHADVSAHLAIVNSREACVVITATEGAAVNLLRSMGGDRDATFEDPMLSDAIGEILNTTAGSAQRLSAVRYQFSIPVIAKGRGHEVKILSKNRSQRVALRLGSDEIGLYLVYRDAKV